MFSVAFSLMPLKIRAKALLESKGVKALAVELDKLGDEGYAWRVELSKLTGSGTVPQVAALIECLGW